MGWSLQSRRQEQEFPDEVEALAYRYIGNWIVGNHGRWRKSHPVQTAASPKDFPTPQPGIWRCRKLGPAGRKFAVCPVLGHREAEKSSGHCANTTKIIKWRHTGHSHSRRVILARPNGHRRAGRLRSASFSALHVTDPWKDRLLFSILKSVPFPTFLRMTCLWCVYGWMFICVCVCMHVHIHVHICVQKPKEARRRCQISQSWS